MDQSIKIIFGRYNLFVRFQHLEAITFLICSFHLIWSNTASKNKQLALDCNPMQTWENFTQAQSLTQKPSKPQTKNVLPNPKKMAKGPCCMRRSAAGRACHAFYPFKRTPVFFMGAACFPSILNSFSFKSSWLREPAEACFLGCLKKTKHPNRFNRLKSLSSQSPSPVFGRRSLDQGSQSLDLWRCASWGWFFEDDAHSFHDARMGRSLTWSVEKCRHSVAFEYNPPLRLEAFGRSKLFVCYVRNLRQVVVVYRI